MDGRLLIGRKILFQFCLLISQKCVAEFEGKVNNVEGSQGHSGVPLL